MVGSAPDEGDEDDLMLGYTREGYEFDGSVLGSTGEESQEDDSMLGSTGEEDRENNCIDTTMHVSFLWENLPDHFYIVMYISRLSMLFCTF